MSRYLVKFKDPTRAEAKTQEYEVEEEDADEAIKKAIRLYQPYGTVYGVTQIPSKED